MTQFEGHRWLLIPVAIVKAGFAALPLEHWRIGRLGVWGRRVCWLGASAMILWGGVNTVVGNLVLGGAIRPDGGYDRAGMIGYAWLWDPLFLILGLALALGITGLRPSSSWGTMPTRTVTARSGVPRWRQEQR